MMLPAMISALMPMSDRRGIAPSDELVCSVENTWWPVMAARKAIVAVSSSRISPIRMMSGSWRSMERTPPAKSSRAASLMEVCRIMPMGYSTGSSRVMILNRLGVQMVQQAVERGGLAAARGAGDEQQTLGSPPP